MKILLLILVAMCVAQQVAIQFTGQLNQYTILWQAANSSASTISTVKFGYSENSMTETASGTATPFTACLVYRSMTREVLITVQPDRDVHFSVASEPNGPWSKTFQFKSAPSGTHDFSFVTYGDTGRGATSKKILDLVVRENPRFIVHSGDYAYDQAWSQPTWDDWGNFYEPLTSRFPYVTVVGNHEWNCLFRFENYGGRFSQMLARSSRGNANFWYSMIYSHVHFIALSSEHPIDPPSVQYKWLEEELKRVDRKKTPWVIVSIHQPGYCSLASRYPGNTLVRGIEPLLVRGGVELVLAGHDHDYEASCPVTDSKCGSGPIWMIAGTGGAGDRGPFREPKPEWIRHREVSNGFVKIDVSANILRWKFIRVNDTIGDEWIIRK